MHSFSIGNTNYDRRSLTVVARKEVAGEKVKQGLFRFNYKITKTVYKNVMDKYFYFEEYLEKVKFEEISKARAEVLIAELNAKPEQQPNFLDKFPKEQQVDHSRRL